MKLSVHFPYVHRDVDRHGNVRLYFRRAVGLAKVRLRARPGTTEFAIEYERAKSQDAARASVEERVRIERPKRGTLEWLCLSYINSSEFARLSASTQVTRRRILDACVAEAIAPLKPETFAQFPLDRLTAKALRVLRDRKASLPGAANDRVKALRAMFSWAIDHDIVDANPSLELKRIRYASTGHHAWSTSEIKQFEAHHPIGSKARLALALLLWTGLRRSDVVRIGKQHIKDEWFRIPLLKNSARSPMTVELPIASELADIIAASQVGDLTFLTTEYGKPFTAAGFGQWFRDRCDEAGLGHCAAHGLRKAGAVRAAENGATAHELMALFGWLSLAEAQRYTRSADRRALARNATKLLARENK
jgi:site-specific recombinase XerD